MRLSEVSKGPHPKKYLAARAAREFPKSRPASDLPKGKLYRTAGGELVAVQRTADGSLIVTRNGKRYTVAKSFVGGGKARPITSLSPKARAVLRRNLEGERALRTGKSRPTAFVSVSGMPPTRPPSVGQRRIDGVLVAQKQGQQIFEPSPVSGLVRPTGVRNVGVERVRGESARARQVVNSTVAEASSRGLKFRKPIVVRTNQSVSDMSPTGGVPAAGGASYGVTRDHLSSKTVSLAPKAGRAETAHELWHAAGKPNRQINMRFRARPNRSAVREEAAADAFASKLTNAKVDLKSGYAAAAPKGGEYDRTFAAARGRPLRMPGRSLIRRAADANKPFEIKMPDMSRAMMGGRRGVDAGQRYNRNLLERARLRGT